MIIIFHPQQAGLRFFACLKLCMRCVGPEVHFLVELICALPSVPSSFLTLVSTKVCILHLASLEQVRGDLILYVVCPVQVAHEYG